MIPTGSPSVFRQQIWASPPLISERVVVDVRAAPWSLDFSGRSARKRAGGSGPHHLHFLYLRLCCQKWGSWFSIPPRHFCWWKRQFPPCALFLLALLGKGALLGCYELCPGVLDFPVLRKQVEWGLISPKFGTSSAEMETPSPLKLSLTVELIIEVSIKVQIGGQNNVKYPAYAFRTVWTLLSEVVGKYWL